jgi:hypothetical protein
MVTPMNALASSRHFRKPLSRARVRTASAAAFAALVCIAAYGETPCPGYVETEAGSAFDLASVIRDSGSPQSALMRLRNAVSKVDAGGGCSIFRDTHACEETMTLAHKAIDALQACAPARAPKGTAHG